MATWVIPTELSTLLLSFVLPSLHASLCSLAQWLLDGSFWFLPELLPAVFFPLLLTADVTCLALQFALVAQAAVAPLFLALAGVDCHLLSYFATH